MTRSKKKSGHNNNNTLPSVLQLPTPEIEHLHALLDHADDQEPLDETLRDSLRSKLASNQQRNKQRALDLEEGTVPEEDFESELPPIPEVDRRLHREWRDKQREPEQAAMIRARAKLPAYAAREEIINQVASSQVIVISGETGCGKTTQVPQFILEDMIEAGRASQCRIVCTQPRRISAISVAERVADERGDVCGGSYSSVGYQIQLENLRPRPHGSLLYCTTGVVLQWMRSNPLLHGYSHIILDEIHERDTLSDFLLTALRDILPKRRDLTLVLMSATLNSKLFSEYFDNCPTLNIPGFTYPVKEYYLEDVVQLTRFYAYPDKRRRSSGVTAHANFYEMIGPYLNDMRKKGNYTDRTIQYLKEPDSEEMNLELILELLMYIHKKQGQGAVLVFLPGWDDISKLTRLIGRSSDFPDTVVYPLHSQLPTVNQREVFNAPPAGVRKIVVATNIAETSITINDVVYVVDCGKIKMHNFDADSNITTLKAEWESKANSKQRRGRAGRVQAGICYKLFSRAREASMADFVLPEMKRTRLEEILLQIKSLELGGVGSFLSRVLDPPQPMAVFHALGTLNAIKALTKKENLTPLGFHLARLPMDPQLGRMLLFAVFFRCLDPILTVAASLSHKDPFYMPMTKEREVYEAKKVLAHGTYSDHFMLINAVAQYNEAKRSGGGYGFCEDNFLNDNTLYMIGQLKQRFCRSLRDQGFLNGTSPLQPDMNVNSQDEGIVRAVITAGLYPNVLHVKSTASGGATNTTIRSANEICSMHPKSVNSDANTVFVHDWLVYHTKMRSSRTLVHDATEASPIALAVFGQSFVPGEVQSAYGMRFNSVEVDSFVRIDMNPEVTKVIERLRKAVDDMVKHRSTMEGTAGLSAREEAVLEAAKFALSFNPAREENEKEETD